MRQFLILLDILCAFIALLPSMLEFAGLLEVPEEMKRGVRRIAGMTAVLFLLNAIALPFF